MKINDICIDEEKNTNELLKKNTYLNKEIKLKKKDGTIINAIQDAVRIYQNQYIGFHTDITDRKKTEEWIKNQNLILENAVLQKQKEMEVLFEKLLRKEKLATVGQMAGSIAHELRNPLGSIKQSIFFLNRLKKREQLNYDNPKVIEHLNLIEIEINNSRKVIDDLLEMTRFRLPLKKSADLEFIINETLELCSIPDRIHVSVELNPRPFMVYADLFQIRQVLVNLVTNAYHAIESEGNIYIKAKKSVDKNLSKIEIIDTGTGIGKENIKKVFEPLITTKATGTGLGLSICKQIIENHKGKINIKSVFNKGTTVFITLPDNNHTK